MADTTTLIFSGSGRDMETWQGDLNGAQELSYADLESGSDGYPQEISVNEFEYILRGEFDLDDTDMEKDGVTKLINSVFDGNDSVSTSHVAEFLEILAGDDNEIETREITGFDAQDAARIEDTQAQKKLTKMSQLIPQ